MCSLSSFADDVIARTVHSFTPFLFCWLRPTVGHSIHNVMHCNTINEQLCLCRLLSIIIVIIWGLKMCGHLVIAMLLCSLVGILIKFSIVYCDNF